MNRIIKGIIFGCMVAAGTYGTIRNLKKPKESPVKTTFPVYDYGEALQFIVEKTGIESNIICDVLSGNDLYLKNLGILNMNDEDILNSWESIKEK